MKWHRWTSVVGTMVLVTGSGFLAAAQDRDRGHDQREVVVDNRYGREVQVVYIDRDRAAVREWYVQRERDHRLPPGLGEHDRLPPGLERQLVINDRLSPALQSRVQPCPEELERRLPPPPRDCAHVIIGGHLVLMNRKTSVVLDVVHLEL